MNKKMIGAVLGLAVLAASTAASAHVDLAVGIGVPAYYAAPQPVYVAPPPVAVAYGGYGDYDGWREREWRERREWRRERHWRHEERREERWHDRHGW